MAGRIHNGPTPDFTPINGPSNQSSSSLEKVSSLLPRTLLSTNEIQHEPSLPVGSLPSGGPVLEKIQSLFN